MLFKESVLFEILINKWIFRWLRVLKRRDARFLYTKAGVGFELGYYMLYYNVGFVI